jgi:TRAP-type C4-dicarboxylate transport system substrate-binding protein
MRGANICVVTDTAYIADYVPDYSIMNGPFLYNDYTYIQKLADSDWHKEMMAACSKQGIKILSMNWYFGSRYIISDRVIKTPADMTGLKIRVPQNKMWIETLTAMGGNPTGLDLSEVYSGLAQGVIDAAEAPLSTIFGHKWYEVKKKFAATGHFRAFLGLEMSQEFFNTFSPSTQTILMEEAETGGKTCSKLTAQTESEWQKKLEAAGAVFNDVDIKAFQDACAVVYTKFPEWSPGLYERIKKELDSK